MFSRRVLSLSLLTAISALPLLLQGCTQPAGDADPVAAKSAALAVDDDKDPAFDPSDPSFTKSSTLTTQTLAIGDGWRRIHVFGTAQDIDTGAATTVDRTLVVVQDKSKIASAPVANFVKSDVTAELAAAAPDPITTKGGLIYKKLPPPPPQEVLIVDEVAANDMQVKIDTGAAPTVMFSCSGYDKTLSKSLSTTKTYSENKNFGSGDFTGTFNATATLSASATAEATIHVKKKWCIPYGVGFVSAHVYGNANVSANGHLDGSFAKDWHYEKKLAQPSLGSLSFSIGPVPVTLNFSAPITIGLDASAKGTAKFDGSATGNATFDLTCTSNGCSGSKSATFGYGPGGAPTMSVSGFVEATPFAYAGIHANLYTDWVANAEVGVKAKLKNQLWAYTGNTCGDSNWVNAAVFDSRFAVDLIGKVSLVGSDHGPWTYSLLDTHVKYYDLLPGGSTAASPILTTQATRGSTTVNVQAKMRPCWPWAEPMQYEIGWGDGTTDTTGFGAPATASHTYGAMGFKTVTAKPIVDTAGRGPGMPTSRKVFLTNFDLGDLTTTGDLVLSP